LFKRCLIDRSVKENKVEVKKLKEWHCIQVNNHEDVGKTIEEWQKNGWNLHTYSTAGSAGAISSFVNHYLLFEKDE
jgi:hypothetical protein